MSTSMSTLPRINYFWRAEDPEDWTAEATALGFDPAQIIACGQDDARAEAERLNVLGLPVPAFDPRLPAFQQAAIGAGAVSAPCPWCGKAAASRESYPVFINAYDQSVFFRFVCCGEFYLIAAKSPQVKVALWLPDARAMVSFMEYRRFPHNNSYYGVPQFREWLKLFRRLTEGESELVAAYRSQEATRRTALALGFVFNFGHHISDELSALPFISGLTRGNELQSVLGPFDFFDAGVLFAEELGKAPLRVLAQGYETAGELFRVVMRENLFVTRLSHFAPLQESVCVRLLDAANKRSDPEFLCRAKQSGECNPLVWVTLRSHNRSWRGQAAGLVQVLNALWQEYPRLGVVFDGFKEERPAMEEIQAALDPAIPVFDGLGTSFFEALAWAQHIDFFIAPLGNGTGFTTIANKPGVVHMHEEWAQSEPFCINRRENSALAWPVVGRTLHEPGRDNFSWDYELDWRKVLDAARTVLASLKN